MSLPFSPRSQAALIEAMESGFTHATLSTLFVRTGVKHHDVRTGVNKQVRAQEVLAALDEQDNAEAAVQLACEILRAGSTPLQEAEWRQDLREALSADGWDWDDEAETLLPGAGPVTLTQERALISKQLETLGWSTAATHLEQALASFGEGRWESANGQLRSFLEALLPRLAGHLTGREPSETTAALQALQRAGRLEEGEFDLARGLWKMSQSRGAHAGRSSEDEARFRLVSTLAYARFALARIER